VRSAERSRKLLTRVSGTPLAPRLGGETGFSILGEDMMTW